MFRKLNGVLSSIWGIFYLGSLWFPLSLFFLSLLSMGFFVGFSFRVDIWRNVCAFVKQKWFSSYPGCVLSLSLWFGSGACGLRFSPLCVD
jgi:hypothetical protein